MEKFNRNNNKRSYGNSNNNNNNNGGGGNRYYNNSNKHGKDIISSSSNGNNNTTTNNNSYYRRKMEMRELEYMMSKLNPMAQEFVPLSIQYHHGFASASYNTNYYHYNNNSNSYYNNNSNSYNNSSYNNDGGYNYHGSVRNVPPRLMSQGIPFDAKKKRSHGGQVKKGKTFKTRIAQREEVIRRTVYVSEIDHKVTEEQLASLFVYCGQVVDCRICGDPKSVLRFAFIEFSDIDGATAALSLSGSVLGFYPIKIRPSKTAIAPVNPTYLPRSEDEREMCARTIYVTHIDKKITQADIKLFFESLCGRVRRMKLLTDNFHSTSIAFVEFEMAESATTALTCSGAIMGAVAIRVSPSKTPLRPHIPRQ